MTRRPFKPDLVVLEDRIVPTGSPLDPATGEQSIPLVAALTKQRSWIAYAPTSSDGAYNANPTDASIQADLQTLYDEGWRGLQTYTMLGTYSHIPKIAKQVGFTHVIAGIFHLSGSDAAAEMANATNPTWVYKNGMNASGGYNIDGFLVGNEGLHQNRYTYSNLTAAMDALHHAAATSSLPKTTSEPASQYLDSPNAENLLKLGDWLFPNLDYFCWANHLEGPAAMWNNVGYGYNAVKHAADKVDSTLTTIVHESWYATSGDPINTPPFTSQANQVEYYKLMVAAKSDYFSDNFYFVWGEAYNQPWKAHSPDFPCCDQPTTNRQQPEPYYGLHGDDASVSSGQRQPKAIIASLKSDYTANYPTIVTTSPPPEDFVNDLYLDVLGRDPAQLEVDGWVDALEGGATPTSVADAFVKSDEHRGLQVDQMYQTLLNRPADPDGRAWWISQLQLGMTLEDLCINFVTSPEYLANLSSDSAFIDELYIDLLGRPADAVGKATWLAALGAGVSRADIVRGFLRSDEATNGLVDVYYLHYLNRDADDAGRSGFAGQLQAGKGAEALILDFLGSDEYEAL